MRLNLRGATFLVLTAAVGIAAAAKGNNLVLAVFAALSALFLGAVLLTFLAARRIEIERIVPDSVWAGEPFAVGLAIRNGKRLFPAFAIRLQDRVGHEGRPATVQPSWVHLPCAWPGHRAIGTYSLVLLHRGPTKLGPVELVAEFPPGFVFVRRTVPLEDEILVYPRRGVFHRRVLDAHLSKLETSDLATVAYRAGHDEFAGLREFRPGDPPRRIHWKMSARVPERLLVREFEDPRVRKAVVLLETYLPGIGDGRRRLRLERAISFAGALVEALLREGYRATFRTSEVEVPMEPRWGAVIDLYATLALLKPSRIHPLADLLARQDPARDEVYFVLRIGDDPMGDWPGARRAIVWDASAMRDALHYEV